MKIRVLGCSGGIGGAGRRTTALLVDDDVLIDCGTGVGDLSLDALLAIDHVFLTHAHLDHIALLPVLLDSVAERREGPLVVHALPETLAALKAHVFNWQIWPDYACLPDPEHPALVMQEIGVGDVLALKGRIFEALPANHAVPAVGYRLAGPEGSLVFSGDTAFSPALLARLQTCPDLRFLLVEAAFPDEQAALAHASRHMTPSELARLVSGLERKPEVYLTHLKPLFEQQILADLERTDSGVEYRILDQGQVFLV